MSFAHDPANSNRLAIGFVTAIVGAILSSIVTTAVVSARISDMQGDMLQLQQQTGRQIDQLQRQIDQLRTDLYKPAFKQQMLPFLLWQSDDPKCLSEVALK